MRGYVYIMASRPNGVIYVGVTSNPSRRIYEHKHGLIPGFTKRYNVKRLVWLEEHEWVSDAIQREKNIKKYRRKWKDNLIESVNPEWRDLSDWLMDT